MVSICRQGRLRVGVAYRGGCPRLDDNAPDSVRTGSWHGCDADGAAGGPVRRIVGAPLTASVHPNAHDRVMMSRLFRDARCITDVDSSADQERQRCALDTPDELFVGFDGRLGVGDVGAGVEDEAGQGLGKGAFAVVGWQ